MPCAPGAPGFAVTALVTTSSPGFRSPARTTLTSVYAWSVIPRATLTGTIVWSATSFHTTAVSASGDRNGLKRSAALGSLTTLAATATGTVTYAVMPGKSFSCGLAGCSRLTLVPMLRHHTHLTLATVI